MTAVRRGVALTPMETRRDVIVRAAVLADELGYETFSVPEGWGLDSTAVLTEIALRTARIQIASGVLSVWGRTPATLAMTAATLHQICGGRYVLGLGAGHRRSDHPGRRARRYRIDPRAGRVVTVSPPDLHAVTTRIPQAGVIVALPDIRRAYQSGDRAVRDGSVRCDFTAPAGRDRTGLQRYATAVTPASRAYFRYPRCGSRRPPDSPIRCECHIHAARAT